MRSDAFWWAFAVSHIVGSASVIEPFVSPLDSDLVTLSGRFDTEDDAVLFGWPLSGFSLNVEDGNFTALLALPFDGNQRDANKNGVRFNRWLNEELLKPILITPSSESWVHLLAEEELLQVSASSVTATLRVARVTEDFLAAGKANAVIFGGLRLGNGAALVSPPPAHSERQLVFIGDSDTAGYGTHGSPDAAKCFSEKLMWERIEDTSAAWASQLAANLGAEVSAALAISGSGVLSDYGLEPFSTYLDRALPFDNSSVWNYSSQPAGTAPDAVIILIGPNDCGMLRGEQCPPGYSAEYAAFTESVAQRYATAAKSTHKPPPAIIHVIAGSGSGFNTADDVARAVSIFNKETLTGCVSHYVEMDKAKYEMINNATEEYNGCAGHYSPAGHAVLAGDIEPAVRKILGW